MTGRVEPAVGLTTATARVILGPGGEPGGRAGQIARLLGQGIRVGLVLDGERLPPEAQLAAELGTATVTLREALAILREQGLVVTRRGRGGGTFARMPPADRHRVLAARLSQLSAQDIRELGDHRAAVSGRAAWLAAERAIPEEIAGLRQQADRLRAAGTPSACRRADAELTIQIAGAAQSSRLTMEELRLRAEVGDLLWAGLSADEHAASVAARAELVEAVARRAGAEARELAERQVAADTRRLLRMRLDLYDRPAERVSR
jgi:DNA-binding FadR family transcriptional regulator